MTLYVDPPEGWRWGFPKAVPKDREHDIWKWIFEQGYPMPTGSTNPGSIRFCVRCWREEDRT